MILATLLYGDYPELARRVLSGILFREHEVRIGLNAVSEATRLVVADMTGIWVPPELDGNLHDTAADGKPCTVYQAGGANILKYPMQRRMFQARAGQDILWLDDDVVFPEKDSSRWLRFAEAAFACGADYAGEPYLCTLRGNQGAWAASRPWWRGVKPDRYPLIRFYRGGILGLSDRFITATDWPDPEIGHNGGDVMCGLAFQQFPKFIKYDLHPRNTGLTFFHPRRGVTEDSVGLKFSP